MKKRVLTLFLATVIATAAFLPLSAMFSTKTVEAAKAKIPATMRISKKVAETRIPSNAYTVKNGKYYLDVKKLDAVARKVVKKGNLKSVSYQVKDLKTKKNYKLTWPYKKGTQVGALNPKGWTKTKVKKKAEMRYFNPKTGLMYKGLKKIDGDYYFFDKKTGFMKKNAEVKVGKKTYYFGEDGKKTTPVK